MTQDHSGVAWQSLEHAPSGCAVLLAAQHTTGERRTFYASQSGMHGPLSWFVIVGRTGWHKLHAGWTPLAWADVPSYPTPKPQTPDPASTHDLYKTADPEAPPQIRDRNGEVVLGLCKRCGRAESELGEPCRPPPAPGLVRLFEQPLGTRFRYPGKAPVYVLLGHNDSGLVADAFPGSRRGQGVYSADESRQAFETLLVEVVDDAAPAVTSDMKSAVRWAPSSAYWSHKLREFFGPDARDGIDALEAQLREAKAPQLPACTNVERGFMWNSIRQHHVPTLLVSFEPVPGGAPSDSKGWKDRDAMAALLEAAAAPQGNSNGI